VVHRKWVVNASPLIVLGKSEHLFLLEELCEELIIPAGVATEIKANQTMDPAQSWLNHTGQQYIHSHTQIKPEIMIWNLGLGESEVLSLTHQKLGV
jgi:predicted nucleic acid-binding protein